MASLRLRDIELDGLYRIADIVAIAGVCNRTVERRIKLLGVKLAIGRRILGRDALAVVGVSAEDVSVRVPESKAAIKDRINRMIEESRAEVRAVRDRRRAAREAARNPNATKK